MKNLNSSFRDLEFGDIFINKSGIRFQKVNTYTKPDPATGFPIRFNTINIDIFPYKNFGCIFVENNVKFKFIGEVWVECNE